MRNAVRRALAIFIASLALVAGLTVAPSPVSAAPPIVNAHVATYRTGVVITLNKTETGALAASLIFAPIVAGLASVGAIALQNKVMWNAAWYQAQAAWYAARGQCLWIWVPYFGNPESGGYRC